ALRRLPRRHAAPDDEGVVARELVEPREQAVGADREPHLGVADGSRGHRGAGALRPQVEAFVMVQDPAHGARHPRRITVAAGGAVECRAPRGLKLAGGTFGCGVLAAGTRTARPPASAASAAPPSDAASPARAAPPSTR